MCALYSASSFAIVPTMDVSVMAKDSTSAVAVLAQYTTLAANLATQAGNIQSAGTIASKLNNAGNLVGTFCAGCSPATVQNLTSTIDNLNQGICQSFASSIGTSGDIINNLTQVMNMLSSGQCAAAITVAGATSALNALSGCTTALQMAANAAASTSAQIQQNTQAMMAAKENRNDAEKKLQNIGSAKFFGF